MRIEILLVALALAGGCSRFLPPPPTVVEVAPPHVAAPVQKAAGGDGADELAALDGAPRTIQGAGFHYQVPSAWTDLDPTTLGSPHIRLAQRNGVAVDSFMTNVNVASERFAGDGPAYAEANLIELRKVSTIRAQRAATAGPRPAGDIEARWQNPGGVPYVTLQRYATNGRDGFVITCSVAATAFDRERPLCERILDSFRVE